MNAAINDAIAKGDVPQVLCLLRVHPLLATTRTFMGGWTPILLAAYHDQPAVVDVLLKRGAPVNEVDEVYRRSCLHWLAHHGQALLAFKLVKHYGANVNLRDAENNTPLHRACRADHPFSVLALLLAGADPRACTEDGDLPADVAGSSLARLFLLLAETRCGMGQRTQSVATEDELSSSSGSTRLKPWREGYQMQPPLLAGSPSSRSTESVGSWEEEEEEEEEKEGERGLEKVEAAADEQASLLRGGKKATRHGVFSIVV